jgi:4-oxalocrotonate tautomerase
MPEIVVHELDGRSVEQKRALIKDLTDAVARNYNVDVSTVTINIVESIRESKARGGVLFSYIWQRNPDPLAGGGALHLCQLADYCKRIWLTLGFQNWATYFEGAFPLSIYA